MSTPFKPKNGIAIDDTVTINATALYIGNSTVNSSFTINSLNIGANVSANTGTLSIGNTTVNSTVMNVRSLILGANLSLGPNVTISNTAFRIGNSTVNTIITTSSVVTGLIATSGNVAIGGDTTIAGDVDITGELTVSSNIITDQSTLKFGNSTINASMNSTSLSVDGTADILSAVTVGSNVSLNTTALSISGTGFRANGLNVGANVNINTSALSLGNATVNTIITQSTIDVDGTVTATAFVGNGSLLTTVNSIALTGTIPDARITGAYTGLTSLSIGSNVVVNTSMMFVGNSTVNTTITQLAVTSDGTITGNLFSGNGASLTSIPAAQLTGTIPDARITGAYTGLTSLSIGSNVVVNTTLLAIGNSTVNTVINSSAIDVDGTITGTTLVGALNSSNLTGTIPDARITGAYTGLTSLSVGSNLVVNTTTFKVGNATVNTVITQSTIDVDGTITGTTLVGALNSSNLTGTIPDARITGAYTGLTSLSVGSNVVVNTTVLKAGNSQVNTTALSINDGVFSGNVTIGGSLTVNGGATFITVANSQIISYSNATSNATMEVIVLDGNGRIELGGSNSASIDLKVPFSDDHDLRLFVNATAATINTGLPLTLNSSNASGISLVGNVNFDSGSLYIDSNGNRIGIACTAPVVNATLDVAGAIRTTTGIEYGSGGWHGFNSYYNGTAFVSRTGANGFLVSSTNNGMLFTFTQGTGIAGANVSLFNVLSANSSAFNVNATAATFSGTVTGTSFSGSGASLTSLNATQLTTGTVASARISGAYTGFSNITASGTVTGALFSGSGASLTALNASQLTTGTIPDARITGAYTGLTSLSVGSNVVINTSAVAVGNATVNTVITQSTIDVDGTITATSFAGSGASLTSLPAAQLTGTVASARISGAYTGFSNITASGTITGALFSGSGASLTLLPAGQLTGTIDNARLPTIISGKTINTASFTGTGYYYVPDSLLGSNVSAAATFVVFQPNTTTGDAFMTFHNSNRFATHFGLDDTTDDLFVGGYSKGANKYKIWHAGNDGASSGLDADLLDGQHGSYYLSATNLTGTIPSARISGAYTGFTNITASGTITADTFVGSGSSLTGLDATQLTGTIADARISGAYTGLTNITASGTITGALFSGSGASLTALNATQLTTGTVASARISGAYTGFSNITASGTITGALFSGSGASLTSIPAGQLTGTIADARISGAYTGLTSLSVGANVVLDTTNLKIGNSSINTVITSSSITCDGTITGTTFSGSGASLTSLPAASLTGTIPDARIAGSYTGITALTLGGGTSITNTNIGVGANVDLTTSALRIGNSTVNTVITSSSITCDGTITGTTFSGSGASLTSLNASQLATGTVPNARIDGSYTNFTNITASGTITGGTFSGSGASLTSIPAGQLTGTVPDARITGSYTGLTNLSVGSNVTVNTSTFKVGNSTVNTIANSSGVFSDGQGSFKTNLYAGSSLNVGVESGGEPLAYSYVSNVEFVSLNVLDGSAVAIGRSYGFTVSNSIIGSSLTRNVLNVGDHLVSNSNVLQLNDGTAFRVSDGLSTFNRSGNTVLYVNQNDAAATGTLVSFRTGNSAIASITFSGSTVSYDAFRGSHWSQLADLSQPDILYGTIVETIDELCEWDDVVEDRLAKFKISDTVESSSVYGIFNYWDEDGDAHIDALGAGHIRVNKDVEVCRGDLLASNGDGTAKKQKDKTIRSSTIAKVTAAIKIKTYDDGSYLVPCVLYCG